MQDQEDVVQHAHEPGAALGSRIAANKKSSSQSWVEFVLIRKGDFSVSWFNAKYIWYKSDEIGNHACMQGNLKPTRWVAWSRRVLLGAREQRASKKRTRSAC